MVGAGGGATEVLCGALCHYAGQGWTVRLLDEWELGRGLAAKEGAQEAVRAGEVQRLHLLIVRTVGNVPLAEWESARVREVLTHRLGLRRPTLIDTHLSPGQLAAEPSVGAANAHTLFEASGAGRLVARFNAPNAWEAIG